MVDLFRIIMCWAPGRKFSPWERKCIRRVNELFNVNWLDVSHYDVPEKQTEKLQGPSEWARWSELRMPYTLWSDCDVYWNRFPDRLGDRFLCDKMGGGFRPNDAVVWSGAHPEIAEYVMCRLHTNGSKFAFTHKFLTEALRMRKKEQGKAWDFFPGNVYQHKEHTCRSKSHATK